MLVSLAFATPIGFAQEGGTSQNAVENIPTADDKSAFETLADVFLNDVQILINEGQLDQAVFSLEKRLLEKPFDPRALSLHAKILALQKNWGDFFTAVNKVKVLPLENPDEILESRQNVEAGLALAYDEGIHLARQARYDEALQILQQIESLGYAAEHWLVDKIMIDVWRGNFDQAITGYEALPTTIHPPEYLLQTMVKAYRETGQHEKSLELYDRLIELNPSDTVIRKLAFESALALRSFDLAHAYSQGLADLESQEDDFRFREFQIFVESGDFEKSVRSFRDLSMDIQPQAYEIFRQGLHQIPSDQFHRLHQKILMDEQQRDLSTVEILLVTKFLQQASTDSQEIYLFAPQIEGQFARLPVNLQVEIAHLFLKADGDEVAQEYFEQILEKDPRQPDAAFGMAKIFYKKKDFPTTMEWLSRVLEQHPQHFDALFLKGEIYEVLKDPWNAAKVYDEVLQHYPENRAALNLKLRSLMDLGATSLVLEITENPDFQIDPVIALRAQGNVPMQQIQWDEHSQALAHLDRLIEQYQQLRQADPGNEEARRQYWRSRWDRVLALRAQERMREIIQEYQLIEHEAVEIPLWVHAAAGDAYLYERQPDKALEIYHLVLEKNPTSFNAHMAKYDALVELERYQEAQELLVKLDEQTPKTTTERGPIEPNWNKARITYSKGWLLMYQDRLKEAEEYLQTAVDAAPFNTNILTAQAHKNFWRGWPRRALADFRRILTMDPQHVQARIGYANALNANGFKKEARDEVAAVLQKFPKNKHAQRAKWLFDVEEMTSFGLNASYRREKPGEDEYQTSMRLDHPLTFEHNLYLEMIRRETTDAADDVVQRKIYLGDQWQFNRAWKFLGAVTGDYETGNEIGGLGRITFTPDDHWTFDASFEKNILSVPIRSRAQGVNVDEHAFSTTFRGSELWNAQTGFSFKDFDDGNENWSYFWRNHQTWLTTAFWKGYLDTEFNVSTFSLQEVDYFSPERLYSFYVIPSIEHIWFRRYERSFVERLYLGMGQVWQKSFGPENLGFVRYEQDYRLSDLLSFLWGIRYELNQYDAQDVNALMFYTSLRRKF